MKKCEASGFTITELLAVIVILGILVTVATASYNGISQTLKERTYDNKLDLIKSKAIEYATDYGVEATTISVAKLIEEGYIEQDNDSENNERLSNPLGGYLDCYQIDINRVLDDYEVNISNRNDCSLAQTDILASNLDIMAYKASDDLLINQNYLGSNKDIKWTNDDVYLYLNPDSISGLSEYDTTITWSFNGDNKVKRGVIYNKESNPGINSDYINVYKITTNYLVNTYVTVKVQTDKGLLSKTVNVKIDKERPSLTLDTDASFESSSKVITFHGSDGSGSGFDKYAYALEEEQTDSPNFNIESANNTWTVYENNTYYAYAIDQVGNISEAVPVVITNIDNSKPVCKNPINNSGWSTSYSYTYGCKSDVGTGCATTDINETQTDQAEHKKINWDISDNIGNTRSCEYNLAVNVDRTNPTCSIEAFGKKNSSSNKWFIDDVNLYLSVDDQISGVSEYGITTSLSPVYNNLNKAVLTADTDENGITYYGYVKDKAGNTGTCSIKVYRLKEQPICELVVDKNPDGDNGWYRSNVTIKLNSNSKYLVNKNVNNTNRDNYTVNYDTTGIKIKGEVTNVAGSVSNCKNSIDIKRDTEVPTCTVNASGNISNGWYISDVDMSISTNDKISGVASYGIEHDKKTYNGLIRTNFNWDTTGVTYYGLVKDYAGNQGGCQATVKRSANPPTCEIKESGTKRNGWYISNVSLSLTGNGIGLSKGQMYLPSGTVNGTNFTITSDTSGMNVVGRYYNEAGLYSDCYATIKKDTVAPVPTLRMKVIKHNCQYKITAEYSGDCGNSSQNKDIECDVWDQRGLDNDDNLKSYLGNPISYKVNERRKEWDDYSKTEAELVCDDTVSGAGSYTINNKNGQVYSFLDDYTAKNNQFFTYAGVCYDKAGNKSTTSRKFERTSKPELVDETTDYFGKTDCDSKEITCAEITYECQKGTEEKCVYKKCDKEGSSFCNKPSRNDEVTGSHEEGEYTWEAR